MKALCSLIALLTTVFQSTATAGTLIHEAKDAPPAPASGGVGPYLSLFGGANLYQTTDEPGGTLHFHSEVGWFAGLKSGYVFQTSSRFRPALELEGFYNHTEFRSDDRYNAPGFKIRDSFNEHLHMAAIMTNGLLKYDLGRFQPYIGGGIGLAYVRRDSLHVTGYSVSKFLGRTFRYNDDFQVSENSEEWTFAAQGIAGLEYFIKPNIGLYVEYKALWLRDADNVENYINHLLGGGVRWYF
jgi:opacity protein-like surface antigen